MNTTSKKITFYLIIFFLLSYSELRSETPKLSNNDFVVINVNENYLKTIFSELHSTFVNRPNKKLLNKAILLIRARSSIPFVSVFPYYYRIMGEKSDYFIKNSVFKIPSFFKSFVLYNIRTREIVKLFGKNNPTIFSVFDNYNFANGTYFVLNQNYQKIWVIIKDNYIFSVFEINTRQTKYGYQIYEEVIAKYKNRMLWIKFIRYNENRSNKVISKMVTSIFESFFYYKQTFDFKDYWKYLNNNHVISYLAFFNKSGDVVSNLGINLKKLKFDKKSYNKSRFCLSYIEQFSYLRKKRFIDITNPIYLKTTWLGALKLGFNQIIIFR